MLKGFLVSIGLKFGWDVALGILAWLLRKGYIYFKIELGKDHPLWKTGASIIEDGKINKAEVIVFLQEVKKHIPGRVDDIVVALIVAALGEVDNFEWDQSDKVALFAAIAKMIEDGEFINEEAAEVLDAINEVTGLLK